MTSKDTLKRTLAGGAIATPLALAINRFILGNTSVRSNIIAGSLGLLGGSGAGFAYDIKEKRRKVAELSRGLQYLQEDPVSYLKDTKNRKRIEALIAQTGNKELIAQYNAMTSKMEEVMGKVQSYHDSPSKTLRGFSSNNPLDFIPRERREQLSAMAKDLAKYKLSQGELDAVHMARMEEFNPGLSRKELRARYLYHRNLYNAYEHVKNNSKKNPFRGLGPVELDYIALQAMPAVYRKSLPVMHRVTALERAAISRGGSYTIDHEWYKEPKAILKQLKYLGYSDSLLQMLFVPAAGSSNPLIRLAGILGQSGANKVKPTETMDPHPWGRRYEDSYADAFRWNNAVLARTFDSKKIPIYDVYAPHDPGGKVSHYSKWLPSAADALRDFQALFIKGNFTQALLDNVASRAVDWAYGTFTGYERNPHTYGSPMMLAPAIAAKRAKEEHVYTGNDGNPLSIFDQIFMSDIHGHAPSTGLIKYTKDIEKSYGN